MLLIDRPLSEAIVQISLTWPAQLFSACRCIKKGAEEENRDIFSLLTKTELDVGKIIEETGIVRKRYLRGVLFHSQRTHFLFVQTKSCFRPHLITTSLFHTLPNVLTDLFIY